MSDAARSIQEARSTEGVPGRTFLDPKVLARIDDLELVARFVVEGFISGLHRSPHLGFSTDFAEHRQYMPGDDTRHMDWRVYARTDRLYIKNYEADTNANFLVILDVSGSMGYGTSGLTKLEYAKYLGACLAYFSHRQRDRVGLVTVDSDIVDFVPPSAKHLNQVLHGLDRAKAKGRGSLAMPLLKVSESQHRRSILLLLSDLYEPADKIRDALGPLRDAGHDLVVMHLLDPAELNFTFDAAGTFEDLESGERIPVVPGRLRTRYTELIRDHLVAVEKLLGEGRIDYLMVDTSKPIDEVLFQYLLRRERMQSVR
ncbi:MAG TPA: DUF58 domain-containing protein [Gemmatimonadaceae bacterium]|nr:DUF58 domain-containing protein [Gemmatimonadaceae bacterium]